MKNSKQYSSTLPSTTHHQNPPKIRPSPVPENETPDRDIVNNDTPPAEDQETTPKQPLYQDKTETYYLQKKQKNVPKS